MKPIVTFAALAALTGALVATASPSDARGARPAKRAVVVAAATPAAAPVVVALGGGYYSTITNPHFGYCPQFFYSGAVAFAYGAWGPLCDDP